MSLRRLVKCPTCIGLGYCGDDPLMKCPTCFGVGEISSTETVIEEPCQPTLRPELG